MKPVNRLLSTVLAALVLHVSAAQAAASKPSLEGTWKLAKPLVLLTPANGEPVPFTAEGKKSYDENAASVAKGDYSFDATMTRCASPGTPRIMLSPMRFKLFEREGIVMLVFEWNRLFRQIDMRGKPAETLKADDPSLQGIPASVNRAQEEQLIGSQVGRSRGKWEGNTLVIDTAGFADFRLLDNLIQSSDELKLVERLRLIDNNTLEDRITITDATNFTKPWDVVLRFKRQANDAFPEDVCLDRRKSGQPVWPRQ